MESRAFWGRGAAVLAGGIADGVCLVAYRGESEVGTPSRNSMVGMQPTYNWARLSTTERVSPPVQQGQFALCSPTASLPWAEGGKGGEEEAATVLLPEVAPHSLGHPYKVVLTGKTTEAAREAGSSHPRCAVGHGASCVECRRRNRLGHPFDLWQG